MDSDFSLVEAIPDDVEDIAQQIACIAYETVQKHLDIEAVKQAVGSVIKNPKLGVYYVVKQSKEIVSTFYITWGHTQESSNPDWWLSSVYVKPNFRRLGIFSRFFKQIKSYAQQKNAPVKLLVEQDNERAIKAYEQQGFKRYQGKVFEDDLNWNPFKGELQLREDLRSFIATLEDLPKIHEFITSSQDLLSLSKYQPDSYSKTLKDTVNEGHSILTYRGSELLMVTHYFTELSDWRNTFQIWVYSVRVKDTDQIVQLTHHLINYMKQIKMPLPVGCIRYYADQTLDGIYQRQFEALKMSEAHFYVYELEKS